MPTFDDLPVPTGSDPAAGSDVDALRAEIMRLRESLLATNGRTEVLRDRIDELEARETALAAANAQLHAELGRNPVVRVVRAVTRRLRGA